MLKELASKLAVIVNTVTNCACGDVSQFRSPRCAGCWPKAHNLAATEDCVHSLANKPAHAAWKFSKATNVVDTQTLWVLRTLGKLYVCHWYGLPSRWCRALLFQRHLTRTQPGQFSDTPPKRIHPMRGRAVCSNVPRQQWICPITAAVWSRGELLNGKKKSLGNLVPSFKN